MIEWTAGDETWEPSSHVLGISKEVALEAEEARAKRGRAASFRQWLGIKAGMGDKRAKEMQLILQGKEGCGGWKLWEMFTDYAAEQFGMAWQRQ